MAEVYFSLGSNLGDRFLNIKLALNHLESMIGSPAIVSEIIETKAVGFDGPDFLNCVVLFKTRKRPMTLLRICKCIEQEMGRTDEVEYDAQGKRIFHDRPIDIDILYYSDLKIETDQLTIPHPRLKERPFFTELVNSLKGAK